MHKFLKLGKYTINPNAIAYIDWNHQFRNFPGDEPIKSVKVYFNIPVGSSDFIQSHSVDFDIDSPEAKALHKYFYNPHFGLDLLLLYSKEEQDNEWLESRVNMEHRD